MYSIFCDGEAIYDASSPMSEYKLVSPKLTMSDNAAGSLTFTMTPDNVGYSSLARLSSEIVVKRDGVEIWSGRVINEEKDFWNNRKITCEGELGYLNDTTQPPNEFHDISVRNFLQTLLNTHNEKASADKQFAVGAVTVTDPNDSLYRYTNYESTLDCIIDKLVNRLGGHLKIRKENGVRYLDYIQDYNNTNTQKIEFGKNLSDFTTSWDLTELATVVLPLGARLEESPIAALDAYLTVEEVNDGSIYICSQTAIDTYGWIETVVHWDNVTTATALKNKAQAYLEDIQFESMVLEISAVDMHYLDVNTEVIKLLDEIQCISAPHGMNRFFPVTKLELPLDAPEDTVFTLGTNVKNSGLSSVIRSGNEAIKARIDQLPSTTSVLDEAKENADAIMKSFTNGYITTVVGQNGSEKLIISDTQDWEDANKYWEWSLNGLAYYKNKTNLGLALTMDGAIVADKITTGTLNADIIRTGILRAKTGDNYWNLETGALYLKKFTVDSENFKLTSDGTITATNANLKGAFNSEKDSYKIIIDRGIITSYYNDSLMSRIANSYDEFGLIGLAIRVYGTRNIYLLSERGLTQVSGREVYISAIDEMELEADDIKIEGSLYTYGQSTYSGRFDFISDIRGNDDGSITWFKSTVYFSNGLLKD